MDVMSLFSMMICLHMMKKTLPLTEDPWGTAGGEGNRAKGVREHVLNEMIERFQLVAHGPVHVHITLEN